MRAKHLMKTEVRLNVTPLVTALAKACPHVPADSRTLVNLCEKAIVLRRSAEQYAVTPTLGRKLRAKGEKVDFHFSGLIVWSRTETGHAINRDKVIREIAGETALQTRLAW